MIILIVSYHYSNDVLLFFWCLSFATEYWNREDIVPSQGDHDPWDRIVKTCPQSVKTADLSLRLAFSTPKEHLPEMPNLQACLL